MILGDNRQTPAKWSPHIRELEWAAGFLEGEGSFHGSKRESKSGVTYIVSAKQVTCDPLVRLQCIFGGQIGYTNRENENTMPNAQPIFRWSTSGSRARGIAMTMYKLVTNRRKAQIHEMLSH